MRAVPIAEIVELAQKAPKIDSQNIFCWFFKRWLLGWLFDRKRSGQRGYSLFRGLESQSKAIHYQPIPDGLFFDFKLSDPGVKGCRGRRPEYEICFRSVG